MDYAAELDELASLRGGISRTKEAKDAWKQGYPYDEKLSRKEYEKTKRKLQIELLKLQLWVKERGEKICIIFEGRDAAGKGGSIKRFTEHLNPRGRARGGAGETHLGGTDAVVFPAVHRASAQRRRDRADGSLLVQPGGCRASDGLLHPRAGRRIPARGPGI
ncbi:polyphosphate kinase 2 family protein [Mycobacteroides abscessus MAB_030201_1075]|uniref:Polyphosphate kinase 2 family protein n=1 Tax=Mycobacteroides abscessus MAB_030201_1075 TaxID=1335410 RepID=A0A829PKG9_9MYCO|nr:polyphosphate kinase 2 family protein [Mycobacteroides abscessus MAB_030201_1075]